MTVASAPGVDAVVVAGATPVGRVPAVAVGARVGIGPLVGLGPCVCTGSEASAPVGFIPGAPSLVPAGLLPSALQAESASPSTNITRSTFLIDKPFY